ncbi:cyclopropane-fatty-acyl-phospholipid synthase family protein [Cognatishimia sp. MH4019]|uniref:SAM-dependent methyltransferase n=1 Tax=Cognatishimia sp. MH4019 TaxID=2854030 RepID=UPI001CD2EBC9|nr:cyclopropane-fatty-acyl-phospholipid synthase family protein [Cognatishimia sp. MH4019]
MWTTIIDRMLSRMIREGKLTVTWPDGTVTTYAGKPGLSADITFCDDGIVKALCRSPELSLGEGYMDGRITIKDDRLYDFLTLLVRNKPHGAFPVWVRAFERTRHACRRWLLRNTPMKARENVAHHYDLSDDLYRLFLDEDMQYSCAYFARPDMSLEDAQLAKKHHIANKLRLTPDVHVLDIGCGWGGMALTLAQEYGARVTGVTLSQNQLRTAQKRAQEAGLADRVQFELRDYRTLDGPYDRIVSVGMFEHVGPSHYAEYFGQIDRLLSDDGIALIHTIGYSQPPKTQSPWMMKYIFPGGHVPALSEIAGPLEASSLWQSDIEIWRLHYAETLKAWRERFEANADELVKMYDQTFIRMWRYYLTACEMSFRESQQAVYQFQLAKKIDAVPMTRDYLYSEDPVSQARQIA